jgi:hypothetical protein
MPYRKVWFWSALKKNQFRRDVTKNSSFQKCYKNRAVKCTQKSLRNAKFSNALKIEQFTKEKS